MPKLTILLFEDTLSFDKIEMEKVKKLGVELSITIAKPPTPESIARATKEYPEVKAIYFNNSIPRVSPEMIIFPEYEYVRGKLFSEHFEHKFIFVVARTTLENEVVNNFYVAGWNFIGEFIKSKLKVQKKDGKSTS
jgi:hypothetical protein